MLEGNNINLRVIEKEDIPFYSDLINNPYFGRYIRLIQISNDQLQKRFSEFGDGLQIFIIEKKDSTKIGAILNFIVKAYPYELLEIGFFLIPSERKKGYTSEAVNLLVDYLFLSKEIVRIQAITDERNFAAQRVLEKTGFTKEGIIRKMMFIKGEWINCSLFSILREEWKEPKIIKF
ncbi:MAG: GNAT family N-acetyltransferase [Candidatus Hermodarchaeota archaeon]